MAGYSQQSKTHGTADNTSPAKIRKREQKSGCLGGMLYFMFILCLSVSLAFFLWMAASDVMALNTNDFTATVTLPTSAFRSEIITVTQEDGTQIEKTVTHADIAYVSKALHQAGLVQYQWLFELFCRFSNAIWRMNT